MTTPIFPAGSDQRKDDNSDRVPLPNVSHAHILPAQTSIAEHVKYQPSVASMQKTPVLARPIAPAPMSTQITTPTIPRVAQTTTQSVNVVSRSSLVSSMTPTLMTSTGGTGLTAQAMSSQQASGASMVNQPSIIQLTTTATVGGQVVSSPLSSIIRGATIPPQFPSHLPRGAAAAVSALSGPKSGQAVATAILRPGSQGPTIQLPVAGTHGTISQTYHQHIQPRGTTLISGVKPGTPPMTPRASSPIIASQLQHIDHQRSIGTLQQSVTVPNSLQITLQPQRQAIDTTGKMQQQRTVIDATGKIQPQRAVDTQKIQRTAIDATGKQQCQRTMVDMSGKIHPQRNVDAACKIQPQRTTIDVPNKIQLQRTIDNSGKIQSHRATVDASGKFQTQRTVVDTTVKIQPQRTAVVDTSGKIQQPRAFVDSTGKLQTQRATVDISSKIPPQRTVDSMGKIQTQRPVVDISGKIQPHRSMVDVGGGKVQIQRTAVDISTKMQVQTTVEIQGKTLISHPQSKPIQYKAATNTHTPLPSKVVMSQTSISPSVHHGTHQTITSKPGMPSSSAAMISSHMNSPLSISSLATAAASMTSASTVTSTSIPIAKVTPQRHQQQHVVPQPMTTTVQGSISVSSGGITSVTGHDIHRSDIHLPNQTSGGSMYLPPVHRASPGALPITTSIPMATVTTQGDTRPDSRPAVPQMSQFYGHEYYNYSMPPYPVVYPGMTTPQAQALAQASFRPGLITSQTPNLTTTLQATLQAGSAQRLPPVMVPVDSRSMPTHYTANPNTEGALSTSESAVTVTSNLTSFALSQAMSSSGVPQPSSQSAPVPTTTQSASPRPSILRKRTSEGTPVKKPYCALNDNQTQSPRQESGPQSNTSSPKTPAGNESRENSQSSTDTALSNEAAPNTSHGSLSEVKVKQEPPDSTDNAILPSMNSVEASPRKKPRKQLLNAVEELKDTISTDDEEIERLVEVKEEKNESIRHRIQEDFFDEDGVRWTTERTKPNISLLNFYNCSWKARNNHFLRYQDVKPKDERRPTVNELANAKSATQKATGWKLYYMAAQLEDLTDMEKDMCTHMTEMQASLAPRIESKQLILEDDMERIHELTQGNIQRCQLVNDQLAEAKNQMLKILDHKKRILEIINKHMSKRPIKKKERS